jgi:hypothetical protein
MAAVNGAPEGSSARRALAAVLMLCGRWASLGFFCHVVCQFLGGFSVLCQWARSPPSQPDFKS